MSDAGAKPPRARDVVVVEDDVDHGEALRAVLESAGHAVRMCRSVSDALAAVGTRRPDVILTDLALNGESGADLAQRLRAEQATSSIAHIAMTGTVEPDWDSVRHFDLYLRKPFGPEQLLELLEQLAKSSERSPPR